MDFKKLNKKVLILVLVLIVITGVFWSRGWLKSIVSRTNLFRAQVFPELLPSEEIGEVNLENLLPKEEAVEEEADEKPKQGAEISARQLSLEEIQEEVNRIKEEVEKVRQGINKLKTLIEIQKEINNIRKETELLIRDSPGTVQGQSLNL